AVSVLPCPRPNDAPGPLLAGYLASFSMQEQRPKRTIRSKKGWLLQPFQRLPTCGRAFGPIATSAMTPPRIVVFDLDGTLVDTAPDLINALNYVLDRRGLPPLPLASARNMIGAGARKLIERGLEVED